MYELELFAGAGGGLLAQRLLGHHPVGAIEIDPYCRAVLLQRQRDLCLPVFPVWDDVTTFRKDNPNARTTSDGCGQSPENSVFQGVFLARIFRLAERVRESPDQNQASGSKWLALSMKYDRDSHSWKTVRCSPRADLKWSLHHWPGWGMMRDGACWALEISDIRSSASASGFWGSIARNMGRDMTPGTSKAALLRSTYGAQKNSLLCRMLREIDLYPTVSLCELLMDWPDRWSRLEPLAMDRFLRWRRSHGDSSQAA